MKTTCVSSKGRVTIPMVIRKRLGISQGSKLKLVRDHLDLQRRR
jgi:AbrB family looped-hinge helix DNA binding protein